MRRILVAAFLVAATVLALPSPTDGESDYGGPSRLRISRPFAVRSLDLDDPSPSSDPNSLDWDPSHQIVKRPFARWQYYPSEDPHEPNHPTQNKPDRMWYEVEGGTDNADIAIYTYDDSHRKVLEKPYYRTTDKEVPSSSWVEEVPHGAAEGIRKGSDGDQCDARKCKDEEGRIEGAPQRSAEGIQKRSDVEGCKVVDRGHVGVQCDAKRCEDAGGKCRMTVHGCFGNGPAWEGEACAGCKCPNLTWG